MTTLFIDGFHGTVGMALQPHLADLLAEGLVSRVIVLDKQAARDEQRRAEVMREADVVVFCVPDEVAPSAVALAQAVNPKARLLDASAAYRCDPDWLYGLQELPHPDFRNAPRVANPGCFATGCILLARPLSTLLPWQGGAPWVPFQGMTGYSAAGHKGSPGPMRMAQLGKAHRHLPEIARHGQVSPVLTTAIGSWERGMLVQATLPLHAAEVMEVYASAYSHCSDVSLHYAEDRGPVLAEENNGTNRVSLVVVAQPYGGTTVIAAYDNLGKGSAGAAAQNLRAMLG